MSVYPRTLKLTSHLPRSVDPDYRMKAVVLVSIMLWCKGVGLDGRIIRTIRLVDLYQGG